MIFSIALVFDRLIILRSYRTQNDVHSLLRVNLTSSIIIETIFEPLLLHSSPFITLGNYEWLKLIWSTTSPVTPCGALKLLIISLSSLSYPIKQILILMTCSETFASIVECLGMKCTSSPFFDGDYDIVKLLLIR